MFNCEKLFKLQIRPPSLILLITTSQDRWIFPSQSWEVRNSLIIIINYYYYYYYYYCVQNILHKYIFVQAWSLTASQRRRIEAAEMKSFRPLAGYNLYDHKTNDNIRRELQITGILDRIVEYRRNWFQHLQRMPQNRVPLKSYYCRPQGRRTNGRPKKRWREQL